MNTTPNDQPYNSDCLTCGASHTFDNIDDANAYIDAHEDLGHNVSIEAA